MANGLVRNVALGITGALVASGSGTVPGHGTCERFWVNPDNLLEVPEGTPQAVAQIRGGTGDLLLRQSNGVKL